MAVSILPLQALGVDVQEVRHGAQVALLGRLMDVLASGITVTEGAQLSIPGIPCQTRKPEIEKQRRPPLGGSGAL